jgi:folate-binding protein YgfZ
MEGGMDIDGENSDVDEGDLDEYDILRILNCVGEGVPIADRLPLSINYHFLRAISFKKGCYLGQE